MSRDVPNPGTDEAIRLGCTCPVWDNHRGAGYMGIEGTFVFTEGCPVHAHKPRPDVKGGAFRAYGEFTERKRKK